MEDKKLIDIKEPMMSFDKFLNPLTTATREETATLLLIRLILLEPGTFQTHPDMGVGLISRYRFITEDQVPKLAVDIKNQVNKYLPQYSMVDIRCSLDTSNPKNGNVIKIYITSEELNIYVPVNMSTGQVIQQGNKLSNFR